MIKAVYILIFSLFFSIICMGVRCKKSVDYAYDFIDKLDVIPTKKIYKVGDTIWIQSTNPANKLFDQHTNQNIIVDTAGFQLYINYHPWDNTPVNPPDGFCDYIQGNTVTIDSGAGFHQIVGCNGNAINIRIGIVPKHTGTYTLDFPFEYKEVLSCSNRVQQFPPSVVLLRFNKDCNKDIFLSIPYDKRRVYGGAFEEYIDDRISFAFKVE